MQGGIKILNIIIPLYKGKEVIDNFLELNRTNVDDSVKYALLLYCMYKIKGGK